MLVGSDINKLGDRLCGGGGDDIIDGQSGADYLEGNAGNDRLHGGVGNDILLGGAGNDTYVFSSGAGQDTIFDSDGLGAIQIGSATLNGGKETTAGSGLWLSTDKQYRYTLLAETSGSQSLTIYTPNGNDRILVKNFQNGQLGINLDGTAVPTPGATDYTIVGDLAPMDTDPIAAGVQIGTDALGNILTDPNQAQVGRADTLYDSTGNDLLQGKDGADNLLAVRGGDDRLEGGAGDDYEEGGSGNDTLLGGAGSDILVGGADADTLYSNNQITTATAIGLGRSQIGSTLRGDWLNGGGGDDTLIAGADNDVLLGGAGDDLLIGGAGDDVLDGDDDYTAANASWSVTAASDGNIFDSKFYPIYNNNPTTGFVGGDDVLYGGAGNDRLNGLLGDDLLYGEDGNDIMAGGDGDDILFGGAGDDIMTGDFGRATYGDGTVVVQGDDYLDGGDGNDEIYGDGGDDTLLGGTGADILYGDGADPSMQGDDILDGGDGNDQLYAGGGADALFGGAGDDFLSGDFDNLPVAMQGDDLLDGGDGNDTLLGAGGDDTLYGGNGADTLQGGSGADILSGDAGTDTLDGGTGDDTLLGGAGDDNLQGGSGNDILQGDTGADILLGGGGDDAYIFNFGDGQDTLTDTEGANSLRFGAGISSADITFSRTLNDLILRVGASSDQVTIKDWGNNPSARLATVEFADGTTWNTTYVNTQARLQPILGTDNGDTLSAWVGDTTTTLAGGQGSDSYTIAHAGIRVLENPGEGFDAVTSSVDYTLDANVESLTLTGSAIEGIGNELDNLLIGNARGNRLFGGAGADQISGGAGDDFIEGGAGNDTLDGGAGADTYSLKIGSGQDVIQAFDNLDGIVFGAGIDASSITFNPVQIPGIFGLPPLSGTVLGYGDAGDSVFVLGGQLHDLRFADGTRLLMDQFFAARGGFSVTGDEGDNFLANTSLWARTVVGGAGNDVMLGGGADTTYRFTVGGGQDSIADLGGQDTLSFGPGIGINDVWLQNDSSGNTPSFKVHYGANDGVSIAGGNAGSIEKFRFDDGTSYSFAQLVALKAYAAQSDPLVGRNIELEWGNPFGRAPQLVAGTAGNDTIRASNEGNDVYVAGKGNDHIVVFDNDGQGHKKLVFNSGDGVDTLDIAPISHVSLVFGSGIAPSSLRFTDAAAQIRIDYGAQGDRLILNGPVEGFEFANGNQYSYSQMRSLGAWYVSGTAGGGQPGDPSVYQFNIGDGVASVSGSSVVVGGHPSSGGATITTVQFGLGIDASMLSLGKGSLLIRVGDNGDELHLTDFNPNDAYAAKPVRQFLFADGTSLSYNALLDLGFDLSGGASSDVVTGTSAADRINGFGGDDILSGGAGNDVLDGGLGNDTYKFGLGDGVDRLYDHDLNANTDTVEFATSVSPGDVAAHRNGEDLELHLTGTGDSLVLTNWYVSDAYKIEQVRFADGTLWDAATLRAMAPLLPIVGTEGDDTLYSLGGVDNQVFGMGGDDTLAGSSGADILDGGEGADVITGGKGDDTLLGGAGGDRYVYTRGDGWDTITDRDGGVAAIDTLVLQGGITGAELTLTRSPTQLLLRIDAHDGVAIDWDSAQGLGIERVEFDSGLVWTASDLLAMLNHAPEVTRALPDASAIETQAFVYTVPAQLFVDADAGDSLRVEATLADGSALPSWLRFDSASLSFSGTPGDTAAGRIGIRLTATDGAGATASSGFAIDIDNCVTGTAGDDRLVGTAGRDVMFGLAGNDRLNGAAGADRMEGGVGNDTYVVDDAGDTVLELPGEGTDLVQSSIDYTLGSEVENLTLTGLRGLEGTGNALANTLSGNAADNRLAGMDGDDTLNGGAGADTLLGGAGNDRLNGGTGADLMAGGDGNDSYTVDDAADRVAEALSEGTDLVRSSVTYALSDNVENLRLTGVGAIDGSGNALANILTGNAQVNTLLAGAGDDTLDGGMGADVLFGGPGDDSYTVDNAADRVVELAGEGNDTVRSALTYALPEDVENLVLTGSAANNGLGNASNNLLLGNAAANMLVGGDGDDTLNGGAGIDSLLGGRGNDLYLVDNALDQVRELENEGIDQVNASVGFTLGANVENLTLTGSANSAGTGNDLANALTGNAGANTLTGNAGDDVLDGKGGSDVLIGGTGNDTYLLSRGYGNETIREDDASAGNRDRARFGAGIAADQLWFRKVGNNLEAGVIGTADRLTISKWYLGSQYHVEEFKTSNGSTLLDSQVQSLVSAMAAFAPPAMGQSDLSPAYASQLAPVIAANWH